MPGFDLTDEQAAKLNQALGGQAVELSDEEAGIFNQVLAQMQARQSASAAPAAAPALPAAPAVPTPAASTAASTPAPAGPVALPASVPALDQPSAPQAPLRDQRTAFTSRDGVRLHFDGIGEQLTSPFGISPSAVSRGMEAANTLYNEYVAPDVIEPMQRYARFSAPGLNGERAASLARAVAGPVGEYLARAGGQLYYGRSFLTDMHEEDVRAATDTLESVAHHPMLRKFLPGLAILHAVSPEMERDVETALSAAPPALAEQIGMAPLMLIGVGETGAPIAVRASGALGRAAEVAGGLATSAMKGAIGNLGFAVTQGTQRPVGMSPLDEAGAPVDVPLDVAHEAGMGAIFGAGMHAIPALTVFTGNAMRDFARVMFAEGERGEALFRAVDPQAPAKLAAGARDEAARIAIQRSATGDMPPGEISLNRMAGGKRPKIDVNPNAVIVGVDESGKLVAHLWEIPDAKSPHKLWRVELSDRRIAQWVGARARVSGVSPVVTPEALNRLESTGYKEGLFPGTFVEHAPEVPAAAPTSRPMGGTETKVERVTPLPARHEDAPRPRGEVAFDREGNMLHMHGDGTWTINRLATTEERAAALRIHRLARTTDEDGTARYGYLMSVQGRSYLIPPHPDEEIAGALLAAREVNASTARMVEGAELLSIANNVPSSVAAFQTASHDPRIVDAMGLTKAIARLQKGTPGMTEDLARARKAYKTRDAMRTAEQSAARWKMVDRVAGSLGLKRNEADQLLRAYLGVTHPARAQSELDGIVLAMRARARAPEGAEAKLAAKPEPVGPANYPGPENIPETGEPPVPPVEALRELPPETPEQTAARVRRGMIEGALAEWKSEPNTPPPLVRLADGSTAEVVGQESEGFLALRTRYGADRASLDEVVEFIGDPGGKALFETTEELRQAFATAMDHSSESAEVAGTRVAKVCAAARRDGFSEGEIAGALTDASDLPRTSAGQLMAPATLSPLEAREVPSSRPPPVGGRGGDSGFPPSEPPPPPPTSPPPPPDRSPPPEALSPSTARTARFLVGLRRSILNPVHWNNRSLAEASMHTQSQRAIQRVMEQSARARMERAFGRFATPAFRADLNSAALGQMTMDQLAAKHPFVADHRRQLLEELIAKKNELDARVKELGGIPSRTQLMSDEEHADYLARTFYRFMMDPGEWAKLKLKDDALMKRAIDFFEGDFPDAKLAKFPGLQGMTPAELAQQRRFLAIRRVHEILGDPDFATLKGLNVGGESPGAFASMRGRKLESNLNELLRQQERILKAGVSTNVPPELVNQIAHEEARVRLMKELLGESTDGVTNLAVTLGRQHAIVTRLEALNELASAKELVQDFDGMRTHDGRAFVRIPGNTRRQWGNLAGKYLHPDLLDAVTWSENAPKMARSWMSFLGSLFKANILMPGIGGFSPMAHNMFGDFASGIFSGGLDFTSGEAKVLEAFRQAWRSTRAMSNPKADAADLALYQRAVKWGGLQPGFGEQELVNRNDGVMRQLGLNPRATVWDYMKVLANPMKVVRTTVFNPLAKIYDAPSKFFRFASWLGNRQRVLDNPARYLGDRFIPGMSQEALEYQAEALATRWSNQWYPNFDRLGRIQEHIRAAGPVGAAVPSFATEALRINASFPARLSESSRAFITGDVASGADPDLGPRTLRMALLATSLAGMYKAQRLANGITDDDVQQAYEGAPDYAKNHGPGLIADWSRDSRGKAVFRDYSSFFDPLRFLAGRPDASPFSRIVWNVVKIPVAGGLLDGPVTNMFGEPWGLEDAPFQTKAQPWAKHGAGYVDQLLKYPVFPQGPARIANPLAQADIGGQPSPWGRQLLPQQAASVIAGLPTYPSGSREVGIQKAREAREIRQAWWGVNQAHVPRPPGVVAGMVEALGGPSAKEQRVRAATKAAQELQRRRTGGKR